MNYTIDRAKRWKEITEVLEGVVKLGFRDGKEDLGLTGPNTHLVDMTLNDVIEYIACDNLLLDKWRKLTEDGKKRAITSIVGYFTEFMILPDWQKEVELSITDQLLEEMEGGT